MQGVRGQTRLNGLPKIDSHGVFDPLVRSPLRFCCAGV